MADRIVAPEDDFSHSKRIPLSALEKKLERDTRLIKTALHILSVEDPESTHTEAGAVSALLNHWLVNRELDYFINGRRGDDFTALTVIPVNGDYGKGLAAMDSWITIDKQQLVELLRSRGFIVPDILLNPKADRTPNWDKWRLIPKLTASQCAALWANIDPDKIRYVGGEGWKESQEFKDRLDMVEANLYGALKSKNRKVDLRLFAAWVRETGWDAPDELLAMADQRPQDVNWNYWAALALWPLTAACKLVCGVDPEESTLEGDIANIANANSRIRPPWVNMYHQAVSAIKAGTLRVVNGEVTPAEFIVWAQGKGIPIPPELARMAPATDQTTPRRTHNKRKTEARNRAWQQGIDELATKHPGTSHVELCGKLAKEVGFTAQNIRRRTKRPQN